MHQVWEDFRLPYVLSNKVYESQKLPDPYKNSVKCTAVPPQYLTDGTINKKQEDGKYRYGNNHHGTKKESCSLPLLRLCWSPQCLVKLLCCDSPFTEHQQGDHRTQRFHIDHVFGLVQPTPECWVCNDYGVQEADNREAPVSAHLCIAA